MADPRVNLLDNSQSANEDAELNSWLWRLKTQLNTIIRQIKGWMNVHTTLTPPEYLDDPHQQYWHKVLDPAFAICTIKTGAQGRH